jgi:FtsH-binding integral membrane protein
MSDSTLIAPAIAAPVEERSAFLRRAALWTLGGLFITAIVSVISMVVVVPLVVRGGTLAMLVVVYGSFLLSQTVARRMVYGDSKAMGFILGTSAQGVALSFLLLFTLVATGVADGLKVIAYALALTLSATIALLLYASIEKREFSLLRAGLSMVFIPMLLLMVLQLVFPIGGTLGIFVTAIFVAVSVGAMLWKINHVLYFMPTTMAIEGGYEISLGIVVLFWNILSLLNRVRRR